MVNGHASNSYAGIILNLGIIGGEKNWEIFKNNRIISLNN